MKQTSVEWLHEEYMRILKDNDISVLQAFEILDKYNQAKEMEKEQIIELANSFYMTREEKLETIVKLFAKIMFYGEWKWETPNERVITMLMQEVGMYPFKDEDEMISKTLVSEDLYQKAIKEIPTRPTKGWDESIPVNTEPNKKFWQIKVELKNYYALAKFLLTLLQLRRREEQNNMVETSNTNEK